MKKIITLLLLALVGLSQTFGGNPVTVKSPNGKLELSFEVVDGVPYYALNREGKPLNGAMTWLMLSC